MNPDLSWYLHRSLNRASGCSTELRSIQATVWIHTSTWLTWTKEQAARVLCLCPPAPRGHSPHYSHKHPLSKGNFTLDLDAGFIPRNAGQNSVQQNEWGCRKAESAHVCGLAEGCLWKDLFTYQQMSKNKPGGRECGNGGFGVSHVQRVISPPSIACACVSAESLHLVWLFDTPWTAARQDPLSCLCLLKANEQWLQSTNLTLSVVSWKQIVIL